LTYSRLLAFDAVFHVTKCRIQHRLETSCRGLKTKSIQEKH
jgi:hypothetical protein